MHHRKEHKKHLNTGKPVTVPVPGVPDRSKPVRLTTIAAILSRTMKVERLVLSLSKDEG